MKIGVLTGGGDCPGLNPAIRGIYLRAQDFFDEVIGIADGWKGLMNKDVRPLTFSDVDEIMRAGGTILGTSRTNPYKKEGGAELCKKNLSDLGLDAVIALGGEDTLGVASRLYADFSFPVVGVPKTMDNDLSCTDYTFGFDTSVTIAVDAAERLQDTGKSHRRIMVLEVMGRHAGWVALFTAIASGADWVLIPEADVELDKMCEHLKSAKERKGYATVIVSEGIHLPETEEKGEVDEFGHTILKEKGVGQVIADEIEKRTGIQTRLAVIGHIQRGGSPTLFDRMLGVRVGVKAVELVHKERFGKMCALVGNRIEEVPLSDAVGALKRVDKDWYELAKILFK
jgi:6-phosphofructokinase 1